MGSTLLPQDFKDFLKLLNDHKVEYLRLNRAAAGRYKDLDDLEHLPG